MSADEDTIDAAAREAMELSILADRAYQGPHEVCGDLSAQVIFGAVERMQSENAALALENQRMAAQLDRIRALPLIGRNDDMLVGADVSAILAMKAPWPIA